MIIGVSKRIILEGVFFSLLGGVYINEPIINYFRDIFFVTKIFYDSLTYSRKEPAQMLQEQNEPC